MIYAYRCDPCRHQFDVIKRASEMTALENCPLCSKEARREFVPRVLHLSKTAVQHAEYNPGLGCIVKNAQHRKELCKIKGVEEIGSEKSESIHSHYDKARSDKWEKGWEAVDSAQWVGNGESLEVKTTTEVKDA